MYRTESNQHKQPFQRFHNQIHDIGRQRCADMPGNGIAISIIKLSHCPVETRCALFQKLLKGIGHAELTIHYNPFAPAQSHTGGTHQFLMAPQRHCAKVMHTCRKVWWRDLCRQSPVTGLRKCPNRTVRSLPKQQKNYRNHTEQRQGKKKSVKRPVPKSSAPGF